MAVKPIWKSRSGYVEKQVDTDWTDNGKQNFFVKKPGFNFLKDTNLQVRYKKCKWGAHER